MAKPSVKKRSNGWVKRTLASLVMLPVTVGALWLGYPFVDMLALLVGILLCWEWAQMVPSNRSMSYMGAYVFSLATGLFVLNTMFNALVIFFSTVFVWFKARDENHRNLLTLGVPYISVGFASLLWLYHDVFAYHPYNFFMTLWFFVMVWAMDIGGLFVGTTLQGPKLAPKISPNKTWSGLFGGVLLAILASVIYLYVLARLNFVRVDFATQIFFGVLAIFIALVAQIGDLIESAIKRQVGVKDSSNLIPGHGGVFDRIDGLIFAAPFIYWLFQYAIWYL